MKIKQADAHQLKQLALFFDKTFAPRDTTFLRKLSYCLAQGSCYVLDSPSLEGALFFDRDFLGQSRVIALQAKDASQCEQLLRHALSHCSAPRLFMAAPAPDSPLESAATACGFTPCGELSLNGDSTRIAFLSAASTPQH